MMSIDLAERYLDEAHNCMIDNETQKAYNQLISAMEVLTKVIEAIASEEGEQYER